MTHPFIGSFPIDAGHAAYDVVIPCYDRAHCVADAVTSILAQDPPPAQVFLVDDHSSDDSAVVMQSLESAHPGLVSAMLLPRNGGASNARNAGLASCRSPWVAFLDSDDVWLPGAACALLSGAAASGADIVVGHFARVEGHGAPQAPECGWDGNDIRAALATGGVIGPSWSIVRRLSARLIGGFDPSFRNCNDWDFYTRAAAAGARFARIEETVALYRTVAGDRLGNDHEAGAANARRVLSNPYLWDVMA